VVGAADLIDGGLDHDPASRAFGRLAFDDLREI
jgi:hypothetical protein